MTQVIRRSMSYTQGVGRSTSFKLTLPGMYGSIPRCITVCESCGQSHDQSRNHLYDYPVEIDDDLQCQICLQPLVDPVDTICGHTFCYTCIINHLRRNQICPCDRQPLCEKSIKSSSHIVRRILDKLRIVCPNTAYCDATMPRSLLEKHLRFNCPGTYVQCPRELEGCRHVGPRIQLEEHLWSCGYGQDKDRRSGKVYPIVVGKFCVIEIPKGDCDLGLLISQCETTGVIIIEDVLVEGNAYRDGRLLPGDCIYEINNQDFTTKSLGQARLALASLNPLIQLTVLRKSRHDEVNSNAEVIEIVKDVDKPLGIQINTYKHRAGVYVHHLVAGSPADECGFINIGDRILDANGYDIRYSTLDQAATIMAKPEKVVRLLIQHRQRQLSRSASSSRSMSINSERSNMSQFDRSPINPPSDHSSSRTSSGPPYKIYEEVYCPSGFSVGSQKCIIVKKNPDSYIGMSISGGIQTDDDGSNLPVFVFAINPGSPIDQCGKVQRGDLIMSINGTSLVNKTHSEAVEIIQSLVSTSIVRLELIQGDEMFEEDGGGVSPYWREWIEKYNTLNNINSPLEYTITLSREGSQSLGFSIVGGINSSKGDSPIFVKGIAPKSITAQDGRLQCRDQITSINNIPTVDKTQSEVVNIIKSCSGDLTLTIIPHDTYC